MLSFSLALGVLLAPFAHDPDPVVADSTWPQWRGPSRDGQFHGPAWPDELGERLVERWRIDELGPSYSGPVVSGELVFTTATEGEAEEVVRAYDRASGEPVWTARWKGAMEVPFFAARNGSWIRATPAYDGGALFVAGIRDVLVALDASSGEERWRIDFTERFGTPVPQFGNVSSPLVAGNHLFVMAGASLVKLDKRTGEVVWRRMEDHDGLVSPFSSPVLDEIGGARQLLVQTRSHLVGIAPSNGNELWSTPIRTFRGMNILTPLVHGDAVFTAAYGGRSQLLRIGGTDGGYSVESAWDVGVQGYMTSPVLVDGHAYVFSRANRFTCLDLEAGESRWTSPPPGIEYCSMIAQGDRILALANTGRLFLLRATPERYEVLSEAELSAGETWAHLAAAGEGLFVRAQESLVAYDWR